MSNFDREDLIKSLASAMGVEDKKKNDMQNRYNSSTGTLYCNMNSKNNNAQTGMSFGVARA